MEPRLSYGSDYHYLPVTSVESGTAHEILPNVLGLTVQIVNVHGFLENPSILNPAWLPCRRTGRFPICPVGDGFVRSSIKSLVPIKHGFTDFSDFRESRSVFAIDRRSLRIGRFPREWYNSPKLPRRRRSPAPSAASFESRSHRGIPSGTSPSPWRWSNRRSRTTASSRNPNF